MKQDEAEKLARDLMPRNVGIVVLVSSANLKQLCHAILSGDMKREIENAAYERALNRIYASDISCVSEAEDAIHALITPAKTVA